jgi:hypothetical protein
MHHIMFTYTYNIYMMQRLSGLEQKQGEQAPFISMVTTGK